VLREQGGAERVAGALPLHSSGRCFVSEHDAAESPGSRDARESGVDPVPPVRQDRSPSAGPVGPSPDSLTRVRLRFVKVGKVRWTSHRDVARMWERALRRAGLPVAYSGGFSPHPLLSFGLALPTGCESIAEYVDVALDPARVAAPDPSDGDGALAATGEQGSRPDALWWRAGSDGVYMSRDGMVGGHVLGWAEHVAGQMAGRLSGLLPEGIAVAGAVALEPGAESLQQAVSSCTWHLEVDPAVSISVIVDRVDAAMRSAALPITRERKGRRQVEDLRPSLLSLEVVAGDGAACPVSLQAHTVTRPRGVRPSEISAALAVPLGRARRTHQWIERDGCRWEPVVMGAAPEAELAGCTS